MLPECPGLLSSPALQLEHSASAHFVSSFFGGSKATRPLARRSRSRRITFSHFLEALRSCASLLSRDRSLALYQCPCLDTPLPDSAAHTQPIKQTHYAYPHVCVASHLALNRLILLQFMRRILQEERAQPSTHLSLHSHFIPHLRILLRCRTGRETTEHGCSTCGACDVPCCVWA